MVKLENPAFDLGGSFPSITSIECRNFPLPMSALMTPGGILGIWVQKKLTLLELGLHSKMKPCGELFFTTATGKSAESRGVYRVYSCLKMRGIQAIRPG